MKLRGEIGEVDNKHARMAREWCLDHGYEYQVEPLTALLDEAADARTREIVARLCEVNDSEGARGNEYDLRDVAGIIEREFGGEP